MKNIHEIEIEVKGQEWTDILDKAFKKKVKDTKIDGFRKGAIPKDVYIKKFGVETLYMDAVDMAVEVAYQKLLKDHSDVIPIIQPKLDIKHVCEDCVNFLFILTTKPEIKLGDYKKLNVKKPVIKVTKEEIDKEIENLRSKLADIVVLEKGSVKKGHTAVIDFDGVVDGKPLEGGKGTDYPLEIGSNTFIPGFEDALVGMEIGETKDINLKFPDNYTEELKNKDVTFKVTIKGIKERVLPEVNSDFYKDLGFDEVKDEKEFAKEVEKTIKYRKEQEAEESYVNELLDKAISVMKVELSDDIVDDELNHMLKQYEQQLKMQGLSLEQYFEFTKSSADDLKANMKEEATKRVKSRFLLEEVIDKEKITVTDKELKDQIKKMTEIYQTTEEELLTNIGGVEMIKYDLQMHKAIEILKGNEK